MIKEQIYSDNVIISKVKINTLNLADTFFDDLKENYPEFESWFKRKFDDYGYCYIDDGKLLALLILKVEESNEEKYFDIVPRMEINKKLKISTLKVDIHGKNIGKKFMEIIFNEARYFKVNEIYITFINSIENKKGLISYLEKYDFNYHGQKNDRELVYIKKINDIN